MKSKNIFFCTSCGNEFPKWQGRCPACGSWNTIVEQPSEDKKSPSGFRNGFRQKAAAKKLAEVEISEELRFSTGMSELDRVLGGGAVRGSLVLIGGAPGIGKSTLMLQICNELCQKYTVLYASGEESARQIKLRSQRLGVSADTLYLLSETKLGDITDAIHQVQPDILIVDSIQTIMMDSSDSLPGSITQVKQCTMALMELDRKSVV